MLKILIIDDEEEICALLSGMLRKQGYYVEADLTVAGGFRTFIDGDFNLVFLDLNLSDGSGFDLIPRLKEAKPHIHIYIISAYDGQAERDKAIACGATGFISKPFSRAKIEGAVNDIAKNKNKLNYN